MYDTGAAGMSLRFRRVTWSTSTGCMPPEPHSQPTGPRPASGATSEGNGLAPFLENRRRERPHDPHGLGADVLLDSAPDPSDRFARRVLTHGNTVAGCGQTQRPS